MKSLVGGIEERMSKKIDAMEERLLEKIAAASSGAVAVDKPACLSTTPTPSKPVRVRKYLLLFFIIPAIIFSVYV